MASSDIIRIGTRKSKLALTQTQMVIDTLIASNAGLNPENLRITPMSTSADDNQQAVLADIGGKGLFTKEIEDALLNDRIDIAVHSLKDMETHLPDNLQIGAVLPREDPSDILISSVGQTIQSLPGYTKVGTASMRRKAQLLAVRPDLEVVHFRGNVTTRLDKLDRGEVDATILAAAGLKRLNIKYPNAYILSHQEMLPAAGQGAIAIEYNNNKPHVAELIQTINHQPTMNCILAERAMLRELDGSCRTPIGALATQESEELTLDGLLATEDGRACHRAHLKGSIDNPEKLGIEVAKLLQRAMGNA